MVEVSAIDLVILIDSKIAADAAPEAHALQRNHDNLLAFNLTVIDLLAFSVLLFLDHLLVLGLSLSTVEVTDIERVENLLLHIEGHVSVLHGLQRLIDECQQEGHDDHKYHAIYNNVRVTVCI